MDRLPVFKALGDNTRYAIYLELARSPLALSTADIAEALELHPNTVRPHLERMREAGLLDVEVDNRGTVGRPQHLYSLASDSPSLGLEPPVYPVLSGMLARVAAALGPTPEEVAETGRIQGRAAAVRRAEAAAPAGADRDRAGACVAAVMAELADMGFDPASAGDGIVTTVAFTRCPFRELAEAYPELVCHLHRGIVEGMAAELGGVDVERFGTLADRDPCQVDLVTR
ncbi:MAG: ArsR family transcriptional regulator [Actinobacteria bacterium]|nr:MAG: ArsR family transcriptional regulator [Actinomycetota bacterium]